MESETTKAGRDSDERLVRAGLEPTLFPKRFLWPSFGISPALLPLAQVFVRKGEIMKSILRPLTQKTILAIFIFALVALSVLFGNGPSSAQGGTWSTKAFMPTARTSLGAGVVNGQLYAVGGDNQISGNNLATVEAYDPSTGTWTNKAPMQQPRDQLAVGVINN